ncbi:hypothetical protein [Nocardia coubleae]|uniref:Uncharacterized protein n=1 Tax=Nocardia coubleae TaxID=356147 RepID=A0A846W265_9NOCA|nr:hypothetical protein [Nocardia coubleae]NKX86844.1 hypothetical protein [Nocardia coubleae]
MEIELSTDERRLLWWGLGEWSGPANCSDALAIAMDFEGRADLLEQERRLRSALEAREVVCALPGASAM